MEATLILNLLLTLQNASNLAPADIFSSAQFEIISNRVWRNGVRHSGLAKRTNPATSASWVLYVVDRGTSLLKPREHSTSYRGYAFSVPSGLPLGFDTRFKQEGGHLYIVSAGSFEELSIQMHLQGKDEKGFYKAFPHDWTSDVKMAERFARVLMARAAGDRLGQPATRSFSGYTASAAVCSKTSRVFVDIREWAGAKGWTVTSNSELGYLSLKKGTSYVVLPLGSGKMKVNGIWRTLSDLVAQKNGRDFVVESNLAEVP
ncbi:MAG TPA: stalk domain-containing protein [Fimbriimonadaceae bacterium]|nr:stalk domain-containing protein [Fimbriimonadaceae bacterium]